MQISTSDFIAAIDDLKVRLDSRQCSLNDEQARVLDGWILDLLQTESNPVDLEVKSE